MEEYYERHSNNKRRLANKKGILQAPLHFSKVDNSKLKDFEKQANVE
jgi:hypothetical protein